MLPTLHGSAVAIDGRAVVILGPSGCGKSGLALDLISRGAVLVADDCIELTPSEDGPPRAGAPAPIRGRIEARNFGLITTAFVTGTPVALAVDLGEAETDRLPRPRHMVLAGHSVPLLRGGGVPNLPAAILVALKGGLDRHD